MLLSEGIVSIELSVGFIALRKVHQEFEVLDSILVHQHDRVGDRLFQLGVEHIWAVDLDLNFGELDAFTGLSLQLGLQNCLLLRLVFVVIHPSKDYDVVMFVGEGIIDSETVDGWLLELLCVLVLLSGGYLGSHELEEV